jgi:lipopolysaccharide/colanic/teichoic acid biosynthesis glycosyltransferase
MHGILYQRILKRIVDIVLSVLLILLFSPIAFLTALAIKLESLGPIFADVPARVGQHGRPFKMFKFRSMIANAHTLLRTDPQFKKLYEEYKKGSYKLKEDPRCTQVGKIIRKYSLDELPQFFNVLRGEMSIVGPRAYYSDELEEQTEKYPHTKKLVDKVLSVKPGITGLWQVSGRSDVNFDKRIEIDAEYAMQTSFLQDLIIILKTPYAMVSGKGAV